MARRGMLLTFEGVEGAGKSTQIDLLAAALRDRGRTVRVTREPGGTAIGKEIRRLVMEARNPAPAPMTELLLYLADRAQHLAEVIRPALAAGDIVLCDRFSASTIVYQGFARSLDVELVTRLDELVRGGLKPDLTILLDCPVDLGLGRAQGSDRFHSEDVSFHERIRRGFALLARQDPQRHLVVDAADDIPNVGSKILERVAELVG